jgi:RimJ/RimL family protein N-acetyltransferase
MILAGQRARVAAWVASRIRDMGDPPQRDFEAIGVLKDGALIGGVIYTEFRQMGANAHDMRMHCAGDPGWLTRITLRAFFGYPFRQLGCIRVTATVARANRRALDMNRRLGFQIEGRIRDGYGPGRDGLLLGMLRHECRWIED